ncbi:transcription factor bHLH93-like [Cornus florida]|uniref:transcription factor bHLH93-like n=1 Tax=Cornus florida TaxID=4283 RepID=UPI002899B5E5|nr:transcription factor bHLH93-like [Cornus florida]
MESKHGLLEELLAPRRDSSWASFSTGVNDFFPNGWIRESFDDSSILGASNPPFPCHFNEVWPFVDGLSSTLPEIQYCNDTPPIPIGEENPSMVEDDGEVGLLINDQYLQSLEDVSKNYSQVDTETTIDNTALNKDFCHGEKKSRSKKKAEVGQPSKNLMAERRRRKRLNDRLWMLRSVVPKISKMDRTSIVGDTIDYVKELLHKINKLREEDKEAAGTGTMNFKGNFKEFKPEQILFDAERMSSTDNRIEIRCAAKPGLLVSTINTLEALGLDIQQSAISCFSDFSMQASCSEVTGERTIIGSECIKQALLRNAGYGGRCL